MKYLGVKTEGRGLVIYQSLASQLEGYIRSGDGDVQLGKHLTVDASGDGNYSASLFLKKNNHQYEFFTNAVGKFGAYDKAHSRTLFEADRNTFKHETNVNMNNNRIVNLPTPDGPNQAATKQYVDTKFSEISIPEVDLSGHLTQDTADGRYARASHTHTSSDISDSITRIGTSASANKLVKTDSGGFLEVIHPNDNSPEKSLITKKFFDEKVGALESEVATLKREIAKLKEDSGRVKNDRTNRYLDVWVGPEAIKPDSTNKLVFVEKE